MIGGVRLGDAQRGTRAIAGVQVSSVALGGMSWSLPYALDEHLTARVIYAAIDAGITIVDTARVYTTADEVSHNERVIGTALEGHRRRDEVLVATKCGHHREGPDGFVIDGRPETIRQQCEDSLRLLRCEAIGLYQLHWPDPDVPLVESVGALATLQQEGKVLLIGLSNVTIPQILEAQTVAEIASVQNRFSAFRPDDRETVAWTGSRGIAYLAYQPLGGSANAPTVADQLPAFKIVGSDRGVSAQSVAVAWLLATAANLIPIVGARTPQSIVDSAQAARVELSVAEVTTLDEEVFKLRH